MLYLKSHSAEKKKTLGTNFINQTQIQTFMVYFINHIKTFE